MGEISLDMSIIFLTFAIVSLIAWIYERSIEEIISFFGFFILFYIELLMYKEEVLNKKLEYLTEITKNKILKEILKKHK